MQLEYVIGSYLALVDFVGLILAVLALIVLVITPKRSSRGVLYAVGSVLSFIIGGFFGVVMFITPFPPSPYYVIEWYNVLGVLCGYLLLILAIFQHRRD